MAAPLGGAAEAPVIHSEVQTESHFGAYEIALHLAVKEAVDQAGDEALEAVKAAPTQGYDVGSIIGKAMRSGVERSTKGLGVWIIVPDFRAIFFELGTYTRRRRPVKESTARRRSSGSGQARMANWNGNPGVWPLYFLLKGVDKAKKRLPELLAERLGRITFEPRR